MLMQFGGALVIAWVTVRWALRRYKSEKTWERRLAAYVEAATAIGEMQTIVGRWFDQAVECREPSEELQSLQTDRFRAAKRRLDESEAAALLLLPTETSTLLSNLRKNLESGRRADSWQEHLDDQYAMLAKALTDLIDQGRTNLEVR